MWLDLFGASCPRKYIIAIQVSERLKGSTGKGGSVGDVELLQLHHLSYAVFTSKKSSHTRRWNKIVL